MITLPTKHFLGRSRNNRRVYAHLIQEPLAGVVARNPHILALIREAIATYDLLENDETVEMDMGRVVGYTEVVTTKDDDEVFYALQVKHEQYTRFVKQRKTESTKALFFTLSRDEQGYYQLTSANLGKKPVAFPTVQPGHNVSRGFWDKHAVVYNGQLLRSGTMQKAWPTAP